MSKPNLDTLLHRRQFLLGPRRLAALSAWNSITLRGDLQLQVHPDLAHVRYASGTIQIELLGFVIDPSSAEADDLSVLRALANRIQNAGQAPAAATELGGRWVMIVDDGSSMVIFHDPCGLREIFHTTAEAAEFWCASQPTFIAQELGLHGPDDDAREFMRSTYYEQHHEPWWPAEATPYRQIRHLLPNHALTLPSRAVSRYWPSRQLSVTSMPDAAERAAELLRAGVRRAARRFPLALPITAGMDSRAILAATRDLPDIFYYTAQRHPLTLQAPDIRVPRRLLEQLDLEHHVISCSKTMTPDFAVFYRSNVASSHAAAGAIAEGLLAEYPEHRVTLSGHCGEIARDTFHVTHTRVEGPESLARIVGMRHNPFVLKYFDSWLAEARPTIEPLGYGIWEMFLWENECGNWAANGQAQWDFLHERFTPFNLRPLLDILLSVEPHFRQAPDYALYRRIMEILWPEVLSEAFNPDYISLRARLRNWARSARRHAASEELVRLLRTGRASIGQD